MAWREGIVEGSKQSIYPVLEMLLSRLDELKERAYLVSEFISLDRDRDSYCIQPNYLGALSGANRRARRISGAGSNRADERMRRVNANI